MSLRSTGGTTVRIVDAGTGQVIGDVDEVRAHRPVHTGEIYLHQGRVLQVGTGEVLERIDLDLPPTQLRTVAVWWSMPEGVLDDDGLAPQRVPGSLHAAEHAAEHTAEHAAIGMLPLLALCDRWDLGGAGLAERS